MLDYRWKRLLSGFLALVLVAGMLPPAAVAAEETEATEAVEVLETEPVAKEPVETTVATEVVTEPVEETEAPEETVPETTEATEETVAETTEATEPALPENVAAVQALIDALPTVDTVTAEDYDAVQDAYDAYEALTDEEKALIQGAEVFEALFAWFNAQTATLEEGTCGDNLTWVLDDGVLTISGTGNMTNYSYNSAPWYSNRSSITSVVIEDGATSIGSYAFYGCSSLKGIALPDGLTRIYKKAFEDCTSIDYAHRVGVPVTYIEG